MSEITDNFQFFVELVLMLDSLAPAHADSLFCVLPVVLSVHIETPESTFLPPIITVLENFCPFRDPGSDLEGNLSPLPSAPSSFARDIGVWLLYELSLSLP